MRTVQIRPEEMERRIARFADLTPQAERHKDSLDLPKDVYQMIATGRYQFRTALQRVMARYHPGCTSAELEARSRELLELL